MPPIKDGASKWRGSGFGGGGVVVGTGVGVVGATVVVEVDVVFGVWKNAIKRI